MRLLPRSPVLRHFLAVVVALWSVSALVKYRVVGWPFCSYIPFVGTTLVVLNLVFLVNRVVPFWSSEGTVNDVFTRLDFGARLVIVAFVYWALFVTFNAGLDRAPRLLHRAQITDIAGRTVTTGVPLIYSWARVRWQTDRGERLDTLILGPDEQRKFWGGELVMLAIGSGRFGLPWVAAFERDQEAYTREVLEATPNAVQPWKDLVGFLFDHGPWDQAAIESRRYMGAHPDDGDFAYYAGENLSIRGLDVDAVPFLVRAVELRPSRYHSYRLAWVLTRQGDSSRAIDVLTSATNRYPGAWEFPFLLGYHYAKMQRYTDAVAALQRVEELRPGVPDVAATLARLRGKITAR